MRFDRSLRPFIPSKSAYAFDPTRDPVIDETPLLSTSNVVYDMEEEDTQQAPELIKLRCELRPLFNERTLYGRCTFNEKLLAPCLLWQSDKKPLEAIELHYTGHGYVFENNAWQDFVGVRIGRDGEKIQFVTLISEPTTAAPILYTKRFITLTEDIAVVMALTRAGTVFDYPRKLVNAELMDDGPLARPFWGYGGSFYEQIKISDIMQYYTTLDYDVSKTIVTAYSRQKLWEKGVRLSYNQPLVTRFIGKIVLVNEDVPYHHQSLEEDLVSGLARFNLGGDYSHVGATYLSVKAEQMGLSGFIDITFQRRNL